MNLSHANSLEARHEMTSKFDVSPDYISHSSLFLGVMGTALVIFKPSQQGIIISVPDIDKKATEKLNFGDTANEIGDILPTLMVVYPYLHYGLNSDEHSWEKVFVYTESLMIMNGIVQSGKFFFGRKRPDGSNQKSFPSGHTATAFTVSSFLSLDIYRSSKSRYKLLYAAVPHVFATFVGLSRISGKNHYLTDVVVGGAIGFFTSYFLYDFHFDDKGKYRFNKNFKVSLNLDPISGLAKAGLKWQF